MTKEKMLESVKAYISAFAASADDKKRAEKILKAMKLADRQYFIDKKPYADRAMEIGFGQTISQPSTVARMLLFSEIKKGNDVLELGSGSGWNAAVAGLVAYPGKVLSTEVIVELAEQARNNLDKLKRNTKENIKKKLSKIEFRHVNVLKKLETWNEKYDRIILTAGIEKKQETKIEKLARKLLKDKGILVTPYQEGPLLKIKKKKGELQKRYSEENYLFVQLTEKNEKRTG